jgi:hypothetical protein
MRSPESLRPKRMCSTNMTLTKILKLKTKTNPFDEAAVRSNIKRNYLCFFSRHVTYSRKLFELEGYSTWNGMTLLPFQLLEKRIGAFDKLVGGMQCIKLFLCLLLRYPTSFRITVSV